MDLENDGQERAAYDEWKKLLGDRSQPLNSAMSNSPWAKKRSELNRYGRLLLNARLTEHDTWDDQAVDERGRWLAHRLAAIWPGPEQANW